MCGIAGLVERGQAPHVIERMADSLTHRGPDGRGVWRSTVHPVSLGHRRLSIIDLSSAGDQPMIATEAQLALVYNGELYNADDLRRVLESEGFRFRGHSDTEVVLRSYERWGIACLERLSGMFAFAVVDERRGELVLARDRCGQKPLYYVERPGAFAFASEVKALHQWDDRLRVIDPRGLEEYLAYGYTLGPETLTKSVRKLAAGEYLRYAIDTGCARTLRFWTLPVDGLEPLPAQDVEVEIERLLEDSVRRHLVADVPIGVLLSGGIDSSLISAMAARTRPGVRVFSVGFPGQDRHDESGYARQVATHFGLDHVELEMEGFTADLLERLARQFDDPIADHAIVPTYLLSRRVREEVTVALGGDGGDELFGGYPHYRLIACQARLRRVPAVARSVAGSIGRHMLPVGARGRNHVIGVSGGVENAVAHVNLYFDAVWRGRLCAGCGTGEPEARKRRLIADAPHGPVEKAIVSDFRTTMAEGYLTKVDRASMLSSLEVRAPFLDDRLVDFAFRHVPLSLKCEGSETKIVLRRLAARLLPPGIASKRKQGFTMPLRRWSADGWGSWFRDVLLDSSQTAFDHRAIERLLSRQRAGVDNSARIFSLAMFTLWRRANRISLR